MDLKEFYRSMKAQETTTPEMLEFFHKLSQEAIRITMEINTKYHTPDEIVSLMSDLTGQMIDDSFRLFPPFYTDCGKNIRIGKNVFINAGCKFQDQGGIYIDDGCLIGHNVTMATLNHEFEPEKRQLIHPAPIRIGKNVWIGSNATILQGVTIGEGAIIGANALVTKDIPARSVAIGLPARVVKTI